MSASASSRRVGAESSKTRELLLDCVGRLLLEEGHAGVSYRVLAAKAGVTPSLVQYYFPTLDSLFVAMVRRLVEADVARWNDALQKRPDEPLRVLWEYSWSEASGVLSMELMALGNHRPALRAEIAEATERIRKLQLEALSAKYGDGTFLDDRFSPDAMVLLLTSMPKYLSLEDAIPVKMGHAGGKPGIEFVLLCPEANAQALSTHVAGSGLTVQPVRTGYRRAAATAIPARIRFRARSLAQAERDRPGGRSSRRRPGVVPRGRGSLHQSPVCHGGLGPPAPRDAVVSGDVARTACADAR